MFLKALKQWWNNLRSDEEKVEVITRRGFDITLPKQVYKNLKRQNITISMIIYRNKPSCIQLSKCENGKQRYVGTLKQHMKVRYFKDGNNCNFRFSNLVHYN